MLKAFSPTKQLLSFSEGVSSVFTSLPKYVSETVKRPYFTDSNTLIVMYK